MENRIRKSRKMGLFALFFLVLLGYINGAEIIAGGDNSAFRINTLRFLKGSQGLVKSLNAAEGIQWVEEKDAANPDEGGTLIVKNESEQIVFSIQTLHPIQFFETIEGKIYTLEIETLPRYAIRMAKKEADAVQGKPDDLLLKYIEETRYHLRIYDKENPGGKTLAQIPPIKGNPTPKDYPLKMIPSPHALFLLYQVPSEESYFDLRIDQYSLNPQESKSSILIPKLTCQSSPREFFLKNEDLFMKRLLKSEDPVKAIYDLIKVNLKTKEITVLFKTENLLAYGIDSSSDTLYYITGSVEYGKDGEVTPHGMYLNKVPLQNVNTEPLKEKLPFMSYYGIRWEGNLKQFLFLLKENEPLNGMYSDGGIIAISCK